MLSKIEKLKKEIEIFSSNPLQSFQLNPVIPLKRVQEIENKFKISFPPEYVEFITTVGDGGIIRSKMYGCYTLQPLSRYEEAGYSFEKLKKPFQLTRSWMPDWGDTVDNADKLNEEAIQQLKDTQWEMISEDGHIVLIDDQTDNFTQWILIVSGPCKGEVWRISEYGVQRLIGCHFCKWLELYISDKIEDYFMQCKKIEYPHFFEEDPETACKLFLEKAKYVMNPPIGVESVREIERKHRILFPDEYITLITKIGDGSQKTPGYIRKVHSMLEFDKLENLDKPFLVQTEADYKKIFLDGNGKYRHFGPQSTIWSFLFGTNFNEEAEMDGPWLLPQYLLLNGCIPLLDKRGGIPNKKDTGQCILILNGQYRGQVWGINCWWIKPAAKTEPTINALSFFEAVGNNAI